MCVNLDIVGFLKGVAGPRPELIRGLESSLTRSPSTWPGPEGVRGLRRDYVHTPHLPSSLLPHFSR